MFKFLRKTGKSTSLVKYKTESGLVTLSPSIIKRYLVSGDPNRVSDQELMMFLKMCQYQRLNPFLREAYLIKYGDEAATMVTGKETFTKRAARSKVSNGFEAGITIKKGDEIIQRDGAMIYPGETLIGGWAKAYRKDWEKPAVASVSIDEYMKYKRDGKPMANWAKMPATMIRKVALVQALREAMPEEFGGLYSPEEMPIDESKLPEEPVQITKENIIVSEPAEPEVKAKKKTKVKKATEPKAETVTEPKTYKPTFKSNKDWWADYDWSKVNLDGIPPNRGYDKVKKKPKPSMEALKLYFYACEELPKEEVQPFFESITGKVKSWEYSYLDFKNIVTAIAEISEKDEQKIENDFEKYNERSENEKL